jgi:thiosulfate reductase / polysulfide reductase chain A
LKAEGLWLPMNEEFEHEVAESVPGPEGPIKPVATKFKANTFSVGTIWMNDEDAKKLDLKNGDLVVAENPLGKSTKGKIFASGGMRPGVIKIAFGSGGRFSPGLGVAFKSKDYTPDCNELIDPEALSPIMGQPAYADMLLRIKKA